MVIEPCLISPCTRSLYWLYCQGWGHAVAQLIQALRYKAEDHGFDSRCSLEFVIDIILAAATYNRNEYQEYFLWGKGGRCVGLKNLPPLCANRLALSEPQPLGTLRACPGLYRDCFTFTVKGHNSSKSNRGIIRGSFGKYRTFAHTTRAVDSLYQISHVLCSVECR